MGAGSNIEGEVEDIITMINYNINQIKNIQQFKDEKEGHNINKEEDEEEKVIKKPEKDNDGLTLFTFCSHCKVGNNPESTHCINCGEKL